MRKLAFALTAVTFFAVGARAQALPHVFRQTFTGQLVTFVPCVNQGLREYVDLAGVFNELIVTNVNGTGPGWSAQGFLQGRQRAVGVGETTGTQYHGTGVFNLTFKLYPPAGQVSTEQQNVVVVGGGTTFQLHFNVNFAISPDGSITTFSVDNFTTHCN